MPSSGQPVEWGNVFAWSGETLPNTREEAEARARALLEGCQALSDGDGACWTGEMAALAAKHPRRIDLLLPYAGPSLGIMEALLQSDRLDPIGGLYQEIAAIADAFSGHAGFALWRAEAGLVFLRCLARTAPGDLGRLYRDLRPVFAGNADLAGVWARALALLIGVHSQVLAEEEALAPEAIWLDAAVEEYGELKALAPSAEDAMAVYRFQAEAALQIVSAYAGLGLGESARRWLEETRKLYERFPDDEDTVFSHLYSLGKMIGCAADSDEVELLLSEADRVAAGWKGFNLRLEGERLADHLDALWHYVAKGDIGEAGRRCSRIMAETARLPPAERHRFRLCARDAMLRVSVDAGRLEAAGNVFAAMLDSAGKQRPELSALPMLERGARLLFREYVDAERLEEASALADSVAPLAVGAFPGAEIFQALRDEMRECLRQAGLDVAEAVRVEASEVWAGTEFPEVLREFDQKDTDSLRQAALRLPSEERSMVAGLLAVAMGVFLRAGMLSRAERRYAAIVALSGMFPDECDVLHIRIEAAGMLLEQYCGRRKRLEREAIFREIMEISPGVPDPETSGRYRLAALANLHRARLERGFDQAARPLAALRQLAEAFPNGSAFRDTLAGEIVLEIALHAEKGDSGPIWPLFDEVVAAYEAFPAGESGTILDRTVSGLTTAFLSHDRQVELERLTGLIGGLCQRRPRDRRVAGMCAGVYHCLRVAADGGEDVPDPSRRPENILEAGGHVLN